MDKNQFFQIDNIKYQVVTCNDATLGVPPKTSPSGVQLALLRGVSEHVEGRYFIYLASDTVEVEFQLEPGELIEVLPKWDGLEPGESAYEATFVHHTEGRPPSV